MKNKRNQTDVKGIGAGAVLIPISGLIMNVLYFAIMEKLAGSWDSLLPFRFGYWLFPLMLIADALYLCFAALRTVQAGGRAAFPWQACFMLAWGGLSAVLAVFTMSAVRVDKEIYIAICIKAVLMCLSYFAASTLLFMRKPRSARAVYTAAALICALGVFAYVIARMYLLTQYLMSMLHVPVLPAMALMWFIQCMPLTLRLVGLSLETGRLARQHGKKRAADK